MSKDLGEGIKIYQGFDDMKELLECPYEDAQGCLSKKLGNWTAISNAGYLSPQPVVQMKLAGSGNTKQ